MTTGFLLALGLVAILRSLIEGKDVGLSVAFTAFIVFLAGGRRTALLRDEHHARVIASLDRRLTVEVGEDTFSEQSELVQGILGGAHGPHYDL